MAARVACVCIALAVLVTGQDVVQLDDPAGGEWTTTLLDEGHGQTKLWAKSGKVPTATTFYKTITRLEHHGNCRGACYQDKNCGGYSWVPATHTCKLFAAPNFLSRPFSNDKWHKDAAKVTGKKYKKDQSTGKANSKLAKGLKKVKKQKPLHKRKKTVNGHVHLGLESKANKALKRGAKSAKGGSIATQLKLYKSKLYSEFTKKYKHEYTARAEKRIAKRAHKIADKRVKKLNKKHKKKVTQPQARELFKQARKEVEGHAVRQMQRSFKKHLKSWSNAKVFAKLNQLKAEKRKRKQMAAAKKAKKKKMAKSLMQKPLPKAKTQRKVAKKVAKAVAAAVKKTKKKAKKKLKSAVKRAKKKAVKKAISKPPKAKKKKTNKPAVKKKAKKKP